MILQDLQQYYHLLSSDPDSGVAPRFYTSAPVSFAFKLSVHGKLLSVIPLYDMKGKKKIVGRQLVPEQVVRTSKPLANYLCDNSGYVLGVDKKGKPERSTQTFQAFVELHEQVLAGVADAGATALLSFLRPREAGDCSESVLQEYKEDLLAGGNIVFMLDGDTGYLHQRPALRTAWERYRQRTHSDTVAQCLVTGEVRPIASVHPAIKGVAGAQSTGAAVVSFNADAYCSYGKTQSLNAPISEKAAFAYTTALNYLLGSRKNSVLLGDTTTVFWAEQRGQEELLFSELMSGLPDTSTPEISSETTQLLSDTLQRMRNGQSIRELQLDPDVRMHILGLAPNAARISVRFYQTQPFGGLLERYIQHQDDMEVVPDGRSPREVAPIWRLFDETAVAGKRENVPSALITGTANAIWAGLPYPHSLYQAIIMRIRADKEINATRAGIVKACLTRWQRRDHGNEEEFTVALNEESTQRGYLLGRLFALLEKAQMNAQGTGLNRTIRGTYFGSASATPATVFPQLLRLVQYHIAKSESNVWVDREIGKVLDKLAVEPGSASNPWGFPTTLNLKEQGLFMLGYYQQRQDLYRPRRNLNQNSKEEE
jgi:CRISPR-associated protein Csd1